jgi:hypothetical protein
VAFWMRHFLNALMVVGSQMIKTFKSGNSLFLIFFPTILKISDDSCSLSLWWTKSWSGRNESYKKHEWIITDKLLSNKPGSSWCFLIISFFFNDLWTFLLCGSSKDGLTTSNSRLQRVFFLGMSLFESFWIRIGLGLIAFTGGRLQWNMEFISDDD